LYQSVGALATESGADGLVAWYGVAGVPDEIDTALGHIFSADSGIYQDRGFQRRVGFGQRPALIHIDLANAWTRPGHAFSCDGMDVIIPAVQQLNEVARSKCIPIVYTTTAYAVTTGANTDMGIWHHKIPGELLKLGSPDVAIDERIAPLPDEQVIVKKRASAFHGTHLAGFLTANGVDTVIITGVTMAGCVRHTTEDAIADGFRPIVVREAVGDRVPGVVEWNLFDIDSKFGDVEPLERVLAYLGDLAPASDRSESVPSAVQ
jgi:nicotinamidase-related amidase